MELPTELGMHRGMNSDVVVALAVAEATLVSPFVFAAVDIVVAAAEEEEEEAVDTVVEVMAAVNSSAAAAAADRVVPMVRAFWN